MTGPARKLATVDDLFAIAEGERRHELIEGVIEPKGAASAEHGAAQVKLSEYVGPFHRRPSGSAPGGWWFGTEVDVYFDEENTFRPDVTGWRRDRVPERPSGALVSIRPDWVCEILSTNRRNDIVKKKRVYHRHQLPHYWILDPLEKTLSVFRWAEPGYVLVLAAVAEDLVHPEPFDALEVVVAELFGDDIDGE